MVLDAVTEAIFVAFRGTDSKTRYIWGKKSMLVPSLPISLANVFRAPRWTGQNFVVHQGPSDAVDTISYIFP